MMRILMLIHRFGNKMQPFINNPVKALSQQHTLKFVCYELKTNKIPETIEVEQIPFQQNKLMAYFLRGLRKYGFYHWFYNRTFGKQLQAVINKFQPDVIHCQFPAQSFALYDNCDIGDIPCCIHIRGGHDFRTKKQKGFLRKFKKIFEQENYYPVYVCDYIRKIYQQEGVNMDNGLLLYSATDTDLFKRETSYPETGKYTFFQVSNFSERKGHIYTLRAFKKLLESENTSECQLILAGKGKRKVEMEQLAEDLDIAQQVKFPGYVTPQEVKGWMEKTNAFVHHCVTEKTGRMEGIPNALMEAMAMEIPVISSYHAGIPELVKDGQHGYLVKEKDVNTYAQRMKDIMSWGLQPHSREHVIKHFSLKTHVRKLENFYQKITKQQKFKTA